MKLAKLLVAATTVLPAPAWACAAAPPPGAEVHIADEEAAIVWDASSHTEHFIRRASFHGTPRDFGFLVPTPTQPTLAESKEELFERLAQETRPPEVTRSAFGGFEPTGLCFLTLSMRGASPSAMPAVRVLERARVGGYDAVVLEARDPGALASWLTKNGYDERPSLRTWLAPYVAAGWKITAFKIAQSEGGPISASPVRMTFSTERPFFPYREPQETSPGTARGSRLLRVYFFADQRHEGRIGDGTTAWPGQTELARPLSPDFLGALPGGQALGAPRYLTLFEDHASPRPGVDELFFTPSPAGDRPRDPVVHYSYWKIPVFLEPFLVALVVGLVWRLKKKNKTL